MKIFIALFFSISLGLQAFEFGIDKGSAQIGPFSVKSCQVLIPYLGAETDSIMAELIKKGYAPQLLDANYENTISNYLVFVHGETTINQDIHKVTSLIGTPYLSATLSSSLVRRQSKLEMGIVGESGAILFTSTHSALLPLRKNITVWSVESFPNCIETR